MIIHKDICAENMTNMFKREEDLQKIKELEFKIEGREKQITELREEINNWKQRYIGLAIGMQEDPGLHWTIDFAYVINNLDD